MNQSELAEKIAANAGVSRAEAGRMVDAVLSAISASLEAGEDVRLSGLGVFSIGSRAAREGRNPATGATIKIPASKSIKFKAAKKISDTLNKK
jgi:DNA-binding protein HU-beta